MTSYKARTSMPSATNKNYIHYSYGGYNHCILISGKSCLPNCVGYAWGRWREILGKAPKLSLNNAENWWGYTEDGYERGQTPRVGAVVCWKKGIVGVESDGAGHVAIVEKVKSNGDIVTSESVYGGAVWRSKTYTKSSNYYLANGYVFQGFIYLPVSFNKYTPGVYKVSKANILKVREGGGTKFKVKSYNELTKNAQEQIYKIKKKKVNGYVKGLEFTVTEVKNDFWGKTPSGWVSLRWCTKIE